MKKPLVYCLLLLLLIVLLSIFLATGDLRAMPMPQLFSICAFLVFYVVALSLTGEITSGDERQLAHRYLANRAALTIGTLVLSASILYQLFQHRLDLYLLGTLVAINLTKVIALAYCYYRK